MKKSFIIHIDSLDVLDELQDDEAGRLFKTIKDYQNGTEREIDSLTKIIFSPFKNQFIRDDENYKETCKRNKDNALKGKRVATSRNHSQRVAASRNQSQPVVADSDSDNDNKKDNKKDNDKEKTWREDFNIYLKECEVGYREFVENPELIAEQSHLNPNVNVLLSIEKGYKNFWGTEAGWKNKKKKKDGTDIGWHMTIINSIGLNKVFFTKEEQVKLAM